MAKKAQERRGDRRYNLPDAVSAKLQFEGPDGTTYTFPLMDLSVTGASFHMPRAIIGVDSGAMLGNAVIRLGRLEVHGNVVVLRVTKIFGTSRSCGVQFYPKTEEDRNELINLIARLDSLPSGAKDTT